MQKDGAPQNGLVASMQSAWQIPSLWEFESRNSVSGVFWHDVAVEDRFLPCSLPPDHLILSLHATWLTSADVKLEGRTRYSGMLDKGSWMIVASDGEPEAIASGPFSLLHVYVPKQLLRETCKAYDIAPNLPDPAICDHGRFEDGPLATTSMALMEAASEDGDLRSMQIDTLCQKIVADMISIWRPAIESAAVEQLTAYQRRRLDDYISSNLDKNHNLNDLAKIAGLSKFHFARAFKASFGRSPMRELRARRLRHARYLLDHTLLPLTEIALACGFADHSHFSRSFRCAYNLAPRDYRSSTGVC